MAHLWDVASSREIAKFEMHEVLQDAAFSPDGRRLATATFSGDVLIWDVETRRQLVALHSDYDRLDLVKVAPAVVVDQRVPRCCGRPLVAV